MTREINYNEAAQATDVETLVEYCKQGTIESVSEYDDRLQDWRNGAHLVESYLEHNTVADKVTLQAVISQLDSWLAEMKEREVGSAQAIRADDFAEDNRTVMIRRDSNGGGFIWAHPADGSPVGTREDRYVKFATKQQAAAIADGLGYEVVSE